MASQDKIQTSVVVLIGTGVVAVLAGFNDQFGKWLAALMIIFLILWFVGNTAASGSSSGQTLVGKFFGSVKNTGVTLA